MRNDPTRHWTALAPSGDASEVADRAREIEAMGLRGVFAPQIYGPPWTTLAACAPVTSRLRLASGIALAFTRSPFETAMTAMDLDRLSNGRFVLGLGPSVRQWSEGYFGMPYGKPVEHLREVIGMVREIVARSHTGTLERLEGQYHSLDFAGFTPLAEPVRARIPIWIAATRPPLVRLAAETADGLMGHPIWTVDWVLREIVPTLRDGLRRHGRSREDLELNLWFWTAIGDRDDAVQAARGTVAFYAGIEQYEEYFAAHGFRSEARACQQAARDGDLLGSIGAVSEEMAATFVLCGSVDEVRAALEPVWDVADSFTLVPPLGGSSEEQQGHADAIATTFYA